LLSVAAALLFGMAEKVGACSSWCRDSGAGRMLTGLLLVGLHHMSAPTTTSCAARSAVASLDQARRRPRFFCRRWPLAAAGDWRGNLVEAPEEPAQRFVVLGAVVVFATVRRCDEVRQTGTKAPDTVAVDATFSLGQGKILLFFFNGVHACFEAAQRDVEAAVGDTRVVAVPVEQRSMPGNSCSRRPARGSDYRFSRSSRRFGYTAYPFGVALEKGPRRQR